ncbi:long-chain-fatty-acid--CoA ligase [alpha proteobacterium U9-1i]|nr:long-chain-fatty-acid--CoA ligase [alpha proteobacterium U9-1i]
MGMKAAAHQQLDTSTTLGALLMRQAARRGEALCAAFDAEGEFSYSEIARRATRAAKGLSALGIAKGDRVAIQMPNCVDFLIAHYAVQLLGAVSVLVNARFKTHEMSHVFRHSGAKVFFTTTLIDDHVNFADLLWQTLPELEGVSGGAPLTLRAAPDLRHVVLCGAGARPPAMTFAALEDAGHGVSDAVLAGVDERSNADDIALMLYTSGTTAAPKGCQLTHRGMLASWAGYAEVAGVAEGETIWVPLPFFHVGGVGPFTAALSSGAAFFTAAHFNPTNALAQIRRYKPEHLYPAFFNIALPLMREPDFKKSDVAEARTMLCVAPNKTQYVMRELMPEHIAVMQVFGMTEASGIVTLTRPGASLEHRLETNGTPLPGAEIRIADPETGAVLGPDSPGEIQFRGAGAFHSYYRDEEATRRTILAGGWVATGDYGKIDANGATHFIGRIKDMLKVGGENVAAAEVEAFLSMHPAVKMSQVVGKADERYGEVPVAFVELLPDHAASESELIEFFEGKLARFKTPRRIFFVTEWPMSATKIQKFKLREQLTRLEQ